MNKLNGCLYIIEEPSQHFNIELYVFSSKYTYTMWADCTFDQKSICTVIGIGLKLAELGYLHYIRKFDS